LSVEFGIFVTTLVVIYAKFGSDHRKIAGNPGLVRTAEASSCGRRSAELLDADWQPIYCTQKAADADWRRLCLFSSLGDNFIFKKLWWTRGVQCR